jgi:apolipoprotein N-acyltransferase
MSDFLLIFIASFSLTAPWFGGFSYLVFFSWLPLFFIWDKVHSGWKRTIYTYLVFVFWNAGATWWIWNASPGGAVLAILANAFLMTTTVLLFFIVRRVLKTAYPLFMLIPFWLSFEYLHQYWDLSWTWLTLGNVFSDAKHLVGWYSFTGTSGGSFWALLVNILLYYALRKREKMFYYLASVFLITPVLFSFFYKHSASPSEHHLKYAVVQPNIDPYNEKFYYDFKLLYERTLRLIKSQTRKAPYDIMVFPETFITYDLDESGLNKNEVVEKIRRDLILSGMTKYVLTGASTYKYYTNEPPSATARKDRNSGLYFDMYNTALWITADSVFVYHKSILVPGVEKMPFPAVLKFLDDFAIDMGGTTGSLGVQKNRTVFPAKEGWSVAPIICYESVYGEYVGEYVRKGADVLCVITNDGWWGNTPGHVQHLRFGTLRCLEYGMPMLRSANTGISAVADSKGELIQTLSYQTSGVIEGEINISQNRMTFYAKYKDMISRVMLALSILIVGYFLYTKFTKNRKTGETV